MGGVVGYYDDDHTTNTSTKMQARYSGNSIISARGNIRASERIHKYHDQVKLRYWMEQQVNINVYRVYVNAP